MTTTSMAGAWLIAICAWTGLLAMELTLYFAQRSTRSVCCPQRARRERAEAQALQDADAQASQPCAAPAPAEVRPGAAPESAPGTPSVGPQRGAREGAPR
jgi:hypothetical protein